MKKLKNSLRHFSQKVKIDPHLILEINRNADWKAIKTAYFKLARIYHPDLNKNDEVCSLLKYIKSEHTKNSFR